MRTFFKGRFLVAILSNVQPKLYVKSLSLTLTNVTLFLANNDGSNFNLSLDIVPGFLDLYQYYY